MVAEKPDCTGQRFGMLTVLGKGEIVRRGGRSRRLWLCQCDCGNVVTLPRSSFEHKGQKSCGCLGKNRKGKVDNKRRPRNIAGQRFDSLVAISIVPVKRSGGSAVWLCKCDCGNFRELTCKHLNHGITQGYRLNCGSKDHPRWHYPPTPNPYPEAAGKLVAKYLHLTRWRGDRVVAEVEDEKRDRLIRAAWILTYRRQQGEKFSELEERRFILKHLRYARINVFWRRKIEDHGGLIYTVNNDKKQIGGEVTDVTFHNYPVSESGTLGNILLSEDLKKSAHRLKFRRC